MNLKGKTVILCLPGNMYSGKFMTSLLELVFHISKQGGQAVVSQQYSSMVNFARCKVAGADVTRGPDQKPFNSQPYDYMMWIDSDIAFSNEQFDQLLNMDCDVASGWYQQPGGSTTVVEKMDSDYFKEHGIYQFISGIEMRDRKFEFQADYIGFGWVLIKQGVFEKMKYPWFAPRRMKVGEYYDMCSEDVAWCLDAKEANVEVYVNPRAWVGHEKTQII